MTVTRHENGNVGGISPVQYTFKEDIETFSLNVTTMIATIVFKSGKSWNYLYGSPESIQLEGKEEEAAAGMKYSYTLKMLVPKDRKEVELILQGLNQRHLIINAIDMNGVSRYFGNLVNPMRKTGKLQKPATIEGYNGWEVVFTGEFPTPAPYALAMVTNPITPPGGIETS